MPKVVDYYLTLISPYAYLGGAELERIAAAHGATVRVKPVDYGTIFPKTGGLPLAKRAPARQAYRLVELERWRAARDIPLNLHPAHFPTDEALAAGAVIAAERAGGDPMRLAHGILRAVWAEERDIADPQVLAAILGETGQDPALLDAAALPETQAARAALTQEALARGVFGAPTYMFEDEPFWGQDRLDFLARALAR
ncbi:MAG: 2-hydroxychromene-2-carboxylate isomerase [Kiloniellaceae bacterium]